MLPNRWAKRLKTQESVQRSLCRVGFLLLAILPTLFVLSGWLWSITPWSRSLTIRSWERAISLHLGVDVHLRRIENFAPHQYRFQDVTLKHPETEEVMAIIPSIDFKREQASWHIRLHSPVVELSQASNLVHAIHESFLCQPNREFPTTTCSLRGLTLMSDSAAMEPIYVETRFQCSREMSTLQTRFDIANNLSKNDDSPSASFAVERLHDAITPRTIWSLKTYEFKVPCKVLTAFHSVASQLGPEATFQGNVRWEQDDARWGAKLEGIFQKVQWNQADDSRSITTPTTGEIRVDAAEVVNGRLLEPAGLVTTDSGLQCNLSYWLGFTANSASATSVQAASHIGSPGEIR